MNHENCGKLDWARLTANDLWQYKISTEKSLSNIAISTETIMCDDVNCKNTTHINDLRLMYDEILYCLNNASICQKGLDLELDGMNMHLRCICRLDLLLKFGFNRESKVWPRI